MEGSDDGALLSAREPSSRTTERAVALSTPRVGSVVEGMVGGKEDREKHRHPTSQKASKRGNGGMQARPQSPARSPPPPPPPRGLHHRQWTPGCSTPAPVSSPPPFPPRVASTPARAQYVSPLPPPKKHVRRKVRQQLIRNTALAHLPRHPRHHHPGPHQGARTPPQSQLQQHTRHLRLPFHPRRDRYTQARHPSQRLGDSQARREIVGLHAIGDPSAPAPAAGGAAKGHGTACGAVRQKAGEEIEEGGLARPRRAQRDGELASGGDAGPAMGEGCHW